MSGRLRPARGAGRGTVPASGLTQARTVAAIAAVLGCGLAGMAQQRSSPTPTTQSGPGQSGAMSSGIGQSGAALSSPTTQPELPQHAVTPAARTAAPMTPAPPQRVPELRFLVVLDPAHGGSDPGALLANTDPEKTFTLVLAMQLRALLNARGIHTVLTRDADGTVDTTARATTANRSHASACLLLHATSTGYGVHLFTSSIPSAGPQRTHNRQRTFLPWRTAQASYATESLRLESDIHAAFAQEHVPALLGRTSLSPLDNLACPAVAVEVAPFDVQTPVTDPAYRRRIVEALAGALTQWRSDWRLQP